MKLVYSPIPARIILCVAALLVLKSLSTSISERCNPEFSYDPLFLFILFNAITVAVIVGINKPSIDEIDGFFPHSCSLYEGPFINSTEKYSDVDDFEDDTPSSDGYHADEDDDDGHHEDEDEDDSCNDEEESDDLQKRIEDFIAKVINGWREEKLRESL
ncbi:coiled-coil domain-containing protein 1-like [Herrania umbratica]|uniref:Coiled-coil domain-containing protein 1-like n=1 Tax=Herrania umbratica TaxID=108875 RepID=A0A6J0ZY11_9ROSI|nr:coiled-coil domain-containing protein 1-like [Herrania umbratica]